MNLSATYTYTPVGGDQPTTTSSRVRTRERNGQTITSIDGLAGLLATSIDAIADEGGRLHTLTVLERATVYLRSLADEDTAAGSDDKSSWREYGAIATSYRGTPELPVSAVLDLAEQIRAAL
jgi:hypothetical protein